MLFLRKILFCAASLFAVSFFQVDMSFANSPEHDILNEDSFSFSNLVDKVEPAVVSIIVNTIDKDSDLSFNLNKDNSEDLKNKLTVVAQGSGFFISSDGYIVTNNHVVENSTKVIVVTNLGKKIEAKVIGTDKKTDIALLKVVSGNNYNFVNFAKNTPKVGQWVLAVGNPFGLSNSVTAGIVSAISRDIGDGIYDDFIQIDAPINKGNSGGPAFNLNGEVIGVNTAIFSPSGGSIGIAFSIPAKNVEKIVSILKDKGIVSRGWLGVQIQNLSEDIDNSLGISADTVGALVANVGKGSPAEKYGIKYGDVIISIDDEKIENIKQLSLKVASYDPDTEVDIGILRNKKIINLKVVLEKQEEEISLKDFTDNTTTDIENIKNIEKIKEDFGIIIDKKSFDRKTGIIVQDIENNSIAMEAGVQPNDIIVEANMKTVNNAKDFLKEVNKVINSGNNKMLIRVSNDSSYRFIVLSVKK